MIRDADGRPYLHRLGNEPGWLGSLIDFTHPPAVAWWQARLRTLLEMGVRGFKTDFGEQVPADAIFADGRTGAELHNLFPVLYNRATWQVVREYGGILLARSAWAGSQPYPGVWAGDQSADFSPWAGLPTAIVAGQSAGWSGFPYWGCDIVDVYELRALLPAAARLGARTVRVMVSDILCGDRRAMRDTWAAYLRDIERRLHAIRGLAEDAGVAVALENHQDMTSGELVALCEAVGSPHIGVNLDAANPLAVGEDPLAFARRVAPYLKNVHLKDYRLYRTPRGYRLVRCAVGAGVLDVPGLLALCAREAPGATISIELGALEARHVRLLEEEFWPGYPPRRVQEILPVLRLREDRARPAHEEWRTPWERGAPGEELAAYEMEQFRASVSYLHSLGSRAHEGTGTRRP